MKSAGRRKLDNLSDLVCRLRELESEHVDDEGGTAIKAREVLIDVIGHFQNSWFRLGEALSAYKLFYREERGWMAAAKIIGKAIFRDERTVRRILEGYEHAAQAPAVAIAELEAVGLDPAAKKNEPVIDEILTMVRADVAAAPAVSVAKAVNAVASVKAAKKAKSKKPSKQLATSGESLLVMRTPEETRRLGIRRAIRLALEAVPNDMKLTELIEAIEEEMFEQWDQKEPSPVTLVPHLSTFTVREREEQRKAA